MIPKQAVTAKSACILIAACSLTLVQFACNNPGSPDLSSQDEQSIRLTSPAKNELYQIGDTMWIRWHLSASDNSFIGALLWISPDSGKRWLRISGYGSISQDSPEWGNFSWVVAESIGTIGGNPDEVYALRGKITKVKISEYDGFRNAESDYFTILP